MNINRREALIKVGGGIAAIAGLSQLITKAKGGLIPFSNEKIDANLPSGCSSIKLDLQYAKLPIHLTVVETDKVDSAMIWVQRKDGEGFEVCNPFYNPVKVGRNFEPIVELAKFVNQCNSPDTNKPEGGYGRWLMHVNRKKNMIGIMVSDNKDSTLSPMWDGGGLNRDGNPRVCSELVRIFPEYDFAELV